MEEGYKRESEKELKSCRLDFVLKTMMICKVEAMKFM